MARVVHYDPVTIVTACLAVILLGLAKGGFSGVGAMSMPMFALVVPPVQAAAIMLPVLILQDAVSVWAFRKDWDRSVVAWMLPGALVGITIGYYYAAMLPVEAVEGALGAITALFGLYRLWIERGGRIAAASNSPGCVGTLFGAMSGFTSQIAHAGGPPFQMWVTPKKLPHLTFVGSTAIFFAIVNWVKVIPYTALGGFTRENLIASAALAPVAIASTMAGVWLIRRIDGHRFYTIVYVLMVLLGGKLLWSAFTG